MTNREAASSYPRRADPRIIEGTVLVPYHRASVTDRLELVFTFLSSLALRSTLEGRNFNPPALPPAK